MSEYGKIEDHQTSGKDFPESNVRCGLLIDTVIVQFFEEDTVCQTNFLRLRQEKVTPEHQVRHPALYDFST